METTVVNAIELPELQREEKRADGTSLGERLDLVEHLQVRLSVSLGSASMTVSELFELTPGDVLPLDRDADAPVDIRLNGRIIGRGHLVAVGEKFGVRISEINPD